MVKIMFQDTEIEVTIDKPEETELEGLYDFFEDFLKPLIYARGFTPESLTKYMKGE